MENKYRPIDPTPRRTVTGPMHVLALAWVFGAMLALYSAEDVHAWLAWDDDATPVERRIGAGVLALGNATGIVHAREAIEAGFEVVRDPPLFLAHAATPPPAPTPRRVRSTDLPDMGSPRRILLAGASSIEYYFGIELERCLEEFAGIEVRRVGRLGTGLAWPQDLDWPAELAHQQAAFVPDLVLGQFGGNDCRAMVDAKSGVRWPFGTKAWNEEYRRRVEGLASDAIRRGAQVGFLGQFAVQRPRNRRCFKQVDEVTASGAESAGAWFLSLRKLTMAADGSVLETVAGPHGSRERMWIRDDLHLTRAGARLVSAEVCAQLERRLSLVDADPAKGRILRFETASRARGRAIPWYAVMPREIPPEGVPVLYLLHGGGGGVDDWMTAAQEELQRLAVTHGIALVLVDGDPWGWYVDGLAEGTGIETYLIRELVPEVERILPVSTQRGIAGLSMGGHGALILSLRNAGTFASASSMSGVVDLVRHKDRRGLADALGDPAKHGDRWKDRSARQLLDRRPDAAARVALMLTCGDEDRFLEANRDLHSALERMNVPHVYAESPGGHDWRYWTQQLPLHVAWHAKTLAGAQVQE